MMQKDCPSLSTARYRAAISLGLLERLASNETIAAKLRDAGFSDVRVWGQRRYASCRGTLAWDTTAAMPAQIASVSELPAASSPAESQSTDIILLRHQRIQVAA